MSVTITITDPASTPVEELQAVVTMLQRFLPPETRITIRHTPVHDALDSVRRSVANAAAEAIASKEDFEGLILLKRDEIGSLSMVAPEEKAAVATIVEAPDAAVAAFGVPVPPPPAEMPAFTLTPPAPPATNTILSSPVSPELDKDGIPWDGRIHAATKTKTVEAVWKKKRGVDPAEVDRVTAELRTTMMAPAASVVEAPPAQVAMAFATGAAAPVPPVAVPTPPAPPAATGVTFAEFMGHVTGGVTSGRFTREAVAEACAKHGAANLPGLINRPDLIPAVARELGLMA